MIFANAWAQKTKTEIPKHRAKSANNQGKEVSGTFGTVNRDSGKSVDGNLGTFDTVNPLSEKQNINCPNGNSVSIPEIRNHRAKSANNQGKEVSGTFGTVNRDSEERTGNPAREFIELAQRGAVTLHTDQSGGLWWAAPGFRDDPDSLAWLAGLWSEAWPDLFRLLDVGDLDHLLGKRRII
ncbi:hypothetical protein [Desulfonatronum lacustre]|uniref:hypothetical protein n=1 Tax=Desulfonatronum lacustre TaxID=66849 RepID=UPI00048BF7D4|nr:hypothetical protein [Desulfonatronum lacustre]